MTTHSFSPGRLARAASPRPGETWMATFHPAGSHHGSLVVLPPGVVVLVVVTDLRLPGALDRRTDMALVVHSGRLFYVMSASLQAADG